jgi:hypothetical protein
LILTVVAIACGGFATGSLWGAETNPPAARRERAGGDRTKSAQLLEDYRNDLVLIEGKNGKASGFIADWNGRKYLVSNAHVLADIKTPRYRLLDNSPLKLGQAMVAMGHDIIMVNVTEGGRNPHRAFGRRKRDSMRWCPECRGESVVNPLQGEVVRTKDPWRSAPIEPAAAAARYHAAPARRRATY